MLFEKLTKTAIKELTPYFRNQRFHISDISAGFLFMWNSYSSHPDYAIIGDCLVIKEDYIGNTYFHYPVSLTDSVENELSAISEIENYCRKECVRLHLTNVPKSRLHLLVDRYSSSLHIANNRRWRDYLYLAADFRDYPGKKFRGQRNHVNKFTSEYPNAKFVKLTTNNRAEIEELLREYSPAQTLKGSRIADEEFKETVNIISHLEEYSLLCGGIENEGKLIGFSVGEICGDMLVVHIEKALREYNGIYPMLAREFARAFSDGVEFINREDDSGDMGLRKSKLQYNPCEIVDKYNLTPTRAIDRVSKIPELESERLCTGEIDENCAEEYYRLASDIERNRYWGYDWRSEVTESEADAAYFLEAVRGDFRRKEEIPMGIFCEGKFAGEVVLHNFGYNAEAEIGFRLLPEAEGKGFAKEISLAVMEYAFSELNLERVIAKCYRENSKSERTLRSLGMKEYNRDEIYIYFFKTAGM